jgi:hypothetical protein
MSQKLAFILGSLGYTDYIMVGGIAMIALFLWKSSKQKPNSTIVDLKALKITPTK